MNDGITITLSTDVPAGGNIAEAESALLAELAGIVEQVVAGDDHVLVAGPRHYKTGQAGGYRVMRDGEHQPQYTEVRVRAEVSR